MILGHTLRPAWPNSGSPTGRPTKRFPVMFAPEDEGGLPAGSCRGCSAPAFSGATQALRHLDDAIVPTARRPRVAADNDPAAGRRRKLRQSWSERTSPRCRARRSMISSAVPPESGRNDDDRVRCPVAGARTGRRRRYSPSVRRMRARPVVPRRDRNAVLPSEPRSRAGSRLHLRGPCFQRRNRRATPGQHGTATRGTHVRARQIQRTVILHPGCLGS